MAESVLSYFELSNINEITVFSYLNKIFKILKCT